MLFLSFEISRLGIRSKAMSVVFFCCATFYLQFLKTKNTFSTFVPLESMRIQLNLDSKNGLIFANHSNPNEINPAPKTKTK